MWQVWERGKVHAGFWWGILGERDHLKDPKRRWEDYTKMELQEIRWGVDTIDMA
jgi:hypothetical protein